MNRLCESNLELYLTDRFAEMTYEQAGFDDFELHISAQRTVNARHAPRRIGAVIDNLLPTTGDKPMPSPTQILHARACIADAEREVNCLSTRVDAAILAVGFLDDAVLKDGNIQEFLEQKYQRPLDDFELKGYHVYALALAKKLLSTAEHSSAVVSGARPESAAELLDALRGGMPPGQISLFDTTCSQDEASAVLDAGDQLQAARDLMTRKLNRIERK